jgi:hypothetical protein
MQMVKWDLRMVKSEDGVVEWEIGVTKSQDAGDKVRYKRQVGLRAKSQDEGSKVRFKDG